VLEQFASVQVRSDQQRDDRVPQLETPILQATIEDTERFGTKMQPVESSDSPSVRVKPATAETIASAEPEAAVTEVIASTKPQPTHPVVKLGATTSQPEKSPFSLDFKTSAPPPPLRIPFQFPPNGTGAPASERVPASSGPPVPPVSIPPLKLTPAEPTADTIEQPRQPSPEMPPEKKPVTLKLEDESLAPLADRPAAPAKQVAPDKTAIPFRVEQQPVEPLRVSAETDSPKALAATSPVPAKPQAKASDRDFDTSEDEDGPTISLGLKPLFENLPLFQREGDIDALSGTARITFPLDLVQPQLATGRVLIPSKTFQRALPPNYRSLFVVDREETPVSLPLQEILKNLPAGVLKVREDQQRFSAEDDFVTPFSLKAKEDATRLQLATTGPAAEPTKPSAGQPNQTPNPPAAAEKTIDGKDVIAAACQLPGVAGCELMFPDGLNLAGNLPADMALDGLCAMAPTLLQRIDSHMLETKLGSLFAMTLHGENAAVTFLATENVCLAALHKDAAALASESRAKLHELLEQLSLAFAKPEAPHVDH
jgi:predicted regulator of Ras-like GTPase activity (Roadblock/LC7/MglB family)